MDHGLVSGSGNLSVSVGKRRGTLKEKLKMYKGIINGLRFRRSYDRES